MLVTEENRSRTPHAVQDSTNETSPKPPKQRKIFWSLWKGFVVGLFLAGGAEVARMVLFYNTHTVVEGRVYRSAQLPPEKLKDFVAKHNIRTVVNLRGRAPSDWYPLEARATQELRISQEDITTSANHLPSPTEMQRMVEVFDQTQYPILIHCQQGADRTGLACACYMLLYSDLPYDEAMEQLSPRYGHLPMMSTYAMDYFFVMYQRWLAGRKHEPALFRDWILHHYQPGVGAAEMQIVGKKQEFQASEPILIEVTCTNISAEPWEFYPGTGAGIHLRYFVHPVVDETQQQATRNNTSFYERASYIGVAGNFRRTVPPGGKITLKMPVPKLEPGVYSLKADLSEPGNLPPKNLLPATHRSDLIERRTDFVQYGSKPLLVSFQVR